jgi:hypothetical protein
VVLGGVLYAADGASKPDPGQAQATTTAPAPSTAEDSTNIYVLPDYAQIWAAAIQKILTIERPAAGWPGVHVLDAPHDGKVATVPTRGQPFSAEEKAGVERGLIGVVPVQWVRTLPTGGSKACEQPAATKPYVTLGPIVSKPDHVEVATSVWRGCLDAHWLTYRLDKKAGRWQVTGTVGPQAVS